MRFSRMFLAIALLFAIRRATAESTYIKSSDLGLGPTTTLTTTQSVSTSISRADMIRSAEDKIRSDHTKNQHVDGRWYDEELEAAWNAAEGFTASTPVCTIASVEEFGPCGLDMRGVIGISHFKCKPTEKWYYDRLAQSLDVPAADEMLDIGDLREMGPKASQVWEVALQPQSRYARE